jgi:membrane associated rhomboid family serine protease
MTLTLAIIALTCVVSFLAFGRPALVQQLILWPPAIARRAEYWRLLSYGLIHADPGHLFFNMVTLYFFGRAMEPLFVGRLGPAGYLAFYAGALLVSILPTYLRNRDNPNYHSLGASGAVSAVLFAFILLQPWALIFVFFLPVPAIVYAVLYIGYSIYMDRARQDNINHSAHLWGAGYGVLFLVVMEPRVIGVFLERLANPDFLR